MPCNFNGPTRKEIPFIYLENQKLSHKRHFKYLNSTMDANGDIDEDAQDYS